MNRNKSRNERDDKLADKNLNTSIINMLPILKKEKKSINMIKREIKRQRKAPMGLLEIKKISEIKNMLDKINSD